MQEIIAAIQQAIDAGSTVEFIYNGGSSPGKMRLAIPISVTSGTLSARDPTTRVAKTFKLAKVASLRQSGGELVKNGKVAPIEEPTLPELQDFNEYIPHFRAIVSDPNLCIVEGEKFFAVSIRLKNGKPRKSTAVSIQFMDRTKELFLNFETGEMEERTRELTGRERPWRVDSVGLSEGKSLAVLSKAAELFAQEVRALHKQNG